MGGDIGLVNSQLRTFPFKLAAVQKNVHLIHVIGPEFYGVYRYRGNEVFQAPPLDIIAHVELSVESPSGFSDYCPEL